MVRDVIPVEHNADITQVAGTPCRLRRKSPGNGNPYMCLGNLDTKADSPALCIAMAL